MDSRFLPKHPLLLHSILDGPVGSDWVDIDCPIPECGGGVFVPNELPMGIYLMECWVWGAEWVFLDRSPQQQPELTWLHRNPLFGFYA